MNASDKRRLRLILVTALLVLAAFLGILAVAVAGGFWLIILAVLCLVGVIAVDQAMRWRPSRPAPADTEVAPPAEPARGQDQTLLVIAAIAIVILLLFAVVRLATGTGSGRSAQPPSAVTPTGTGSGHSQQPQLQPGQQQQTQPPGQQHYVTAGTDIHLRAAATTNSAILTTLPSFATSLTLTCYEQGEVVFSDPYWYRTSYEGLRGYVSELWLDTGADPAATDVPHC
jgi:hypothetical protein